MKFVLIWFWGLYYFFNLELFCEIVPKKGHNGWEFQDPIYPLVPVKLLLFCQKINLYT